MRVKKKETKEERRKEGVKHWVSEEIRVKKDAMEWTVVTRRMRQKRSEGQRAVSEDKKTVESVNRTVQIFVKVDGCKVHPLAMSPKDKVGDIVGRILTRVCCESRDVYVTGSGTVLRSRSSPLQWRPSNHRKRTPCSRPRLFCAANCSTCAALARRMNAPALFLKPLGTTPFNAFCTNKSWTASSTTPSRRPFSCPKQARNTTARPTKQATGASRYHWHVDFC